MDQAIRQEHLDVINQANAGRASDNLYYQASATDGVAQIRELNTGAYIAAVTMQSANLEVIDAVATALLEGHRRGCIAGKLEIGFLLKRELGL